MSTPQVAPASMRTAFQSWLEEQPEPVQKAHLWAFAGITDLQQAIPSLKSQIDALKAASASSSTSSTTVVENTTVEVAPGFGTVNKQSGNTSYTTQTSDNGAVLLFSDASAVAVTLNTTVAAPWMCFLQNWGAGTVTITPQTGTISSIGALAAGSLAVATGYQALIVFDGTNFWALTLPIVPVTFTAVTNEFLTAYNAATGVFSAAQPSFANISGNLATSQLPMAGLSVTITTAQLTPTGAQGSMTFTNGLLTAQIPAT